jgi:hypothetical protein
MGHVYAAHYGGCERSGNNFSISDSNQCNHFRLECGTPIIASGSQEFCHAKIHEVFWHLFDTGLPAYYGQTKDKQ